MRTDRKYEHLVLGKTKQKFPFHIQQRYYHMSKHQIENFAFFVTNIRFKFFIKYDLSRMTSTVNVSREFGMQMLPISTFIFLSSIPTRLLLNGRSSNLILINLRNAPLLIKCIFIKILFRPC